MTMSKRAKRSREEERLRMLELAVRPVWDAQGWWVQQADALPALNCMRQPEHGEARVYYHTTFTGKALGYSCRVCGWDQPTLIQEGSNAPEVPTQPAMVTRMRPPRLHKMREGGISR